MKSSIDTFVWKLAISALFSLFSPSLVFAAVTFSASDCAMIARNLNVGISGEDVRVLQKLLNSDTRTRLADTDYGSPGMETTYFGEKTRDAVVRFQNLYKEEILFPVGLTLGSGFVGSYTRAKLLKLCVPIEATEKPVLPVSTEVTTVPSTTANTIESLTTGNVSTIVLPQSSPWNGAPALNSPSSYVVSPGDKVSISGAGFTPSGNILHVGTLEFSGLTPNTLGLLEVVIPPDAPLGKLDLFVSNANGESNKSFLIIAEKLKLPPSVTSFSPLRGPEGTVISIIGSGFTSENNEIYFGSAPLKGVTSPDGKTLTFRVVLDIPGIPPWQTRESGLTDKTMPLWFYILNANGMSGPSLFMVTF